MRLTMTTMAYFLLAYSATPADSSRVGPPEAYPPRQITGEADPAVTQATVAKTICVPGYTARVRAVTEADKRRVLIRDGQVIAGCCEVDHLISLELGGTNNWQRNLWAQPYSGEYGARAKDVVETALKRDVCRAVSPMLLKDAQACIVADWVKCGMDHGWIK